MTTSAIAPALLFLVATATHLGDAYPRYAVAPDSVVERVYTSSTKLESKPAKMFLAGEEVPSEGHGELRLRVDDAKTIAFTDTIGAVADGRPTKFTREYVELANTATEAVVAKPPGGDEDVRAATRERVSPLEGRSVRFTWDDTKDEYTRKFDAGEEKSADTELLAGLHADADWLPLVAGGPREKGATFELEPAVFERVQYPAGDVDWRVEGKDPDLVSKAINQQLSENLAGKAKATWQGTREVEGREVGVFEVEADLTSKAEAETPDGAETRSVELELAYEGEVLWDMAAGRIAGYELKAGVRSVIATRRQQETPKGKVELKQVFDLEGTAKHVLTVKTK